jgi:transcriptional regulator with XRE-family HTH domain
MYERRFKQLELAKAAGGQPSYLSKVLRETPDGKPDFRWKYAERLVDALGASLLEVLQVGHDLAEAEDARESNTAESLRPLLERTDADELRKFRDMINQHLDDSDTG